MIETSVMYVSSQISEKVFRIDAIATNSGIAIAGSVPNVKSRITSAPRPPISASTSTLGGSVPVRRLARLGVERVDAGHVPLDALRQRGGERLLGRFEARRPRS